MFIGAGRTATKTEMVEEIKKMLGPRVPWAFFVKEENISQVGPILYQYIKDSGLKENISLRILERLEKIYNDTLARNLIFLEELKKVLQVLREDKIEVILLKGTALIVEGVYSNPALRPMTDIDLLVNPLDFPRLKKILNQMGYDDVTLGPEDFIKNVNGMLVDIDVHTNLVNITRLPSRARLCRIDIDELWKNARKIKIDEIPLNPPFAKGEEGGLALVLSPADCLIDLAIHSVIHHGMSGLLWFLDIVNLLGHCREIDWQEVVSRAKKYRAHKFLYWTLRYIKETLKVDAVPPENVIEQLRPEKTGFIEGRVLKEISKGKVNQYAKFIFAFSSIEGASGKLVFLKESFLPPLESIKSRYNVRGRFFPYLIHFNSIIKSIF